MGSFRNINFFWGYGTGCWCLGWDISNENDRQSCQSRTRNPLDGCESGGTVFVDGVGSGTRFRTVQSGKLLILKKHIQLLMRG
jgi:hypothetical protein